MKVPIVPRAIVPPRSKRDERHNIYIHQALECVNRAKQNWFDPKLVEALLKQATRDVNSAKRLRR